MQIIIKTDLILNTQEVINILYGENDIYTQDWIEDYIKNIGDFTFEQEQNVYFIIKSQSVTSKGYIYNTSKITKKRVFSIQYLNFDNTNFSSIPQNNKLRNNTLWNNINNEINHTVMKRIDHDSLYKINLKFDTLIKTKPVWNTTELIMVQNEITRNYKKDLYSSIVKKMKRFEKNKSMKNFKLNKKINLPCKTIMIDEHGDLKGCGSGIPDINKFFDETEFTIINK